MIARLARPHLLLLSLALLLCCGCGSGQSGAQVESANLLIEARAAIDNGDTEAALAALDKSIEASPGVWAYLERGKIRAEQGDTDGAAADCKAGLELDPGNKDFEWLLQELKKPAKDGVRKLSKPPSFKK